MAGPHRRAGKFLPQNSRIFPLQAGRGGIAHIGIALVPVQAPEEIAFPVEIEPVGPELGRAEAEFGFHNIFFLAVLPEHGRPAGVQRRVARPPALRFGYLKRNVGVQGDGVGQNVTVRSGNLQPYPAAGALPADHRRM